ncbi:MAG: phytoene/squalene synthase family protein [Parasphingorhabdus sp.]|nr:phytoene/squalene synthase family protein [Parasphingorhabdus sp.]
MPMTRAELVAAAQASIADGSKSFALASRLFDRATREHAWLLYAWCRRCDDIADGQDHGRDMQRVADPAARLTQIQEATDTALAGGLSDDPAFAALVLVARECAIPRRFIDDVIAGFAADAAGWRPQHEDDLYRYCYQVAGAVGCMMAIVMGVDPADEALLDRACDLGLAFQLANIARDVGEDAAAGRCYLPRDWLADAGIADAELMAEANREMLAVFTSRLSIAAQAYETSATQGAAHLPFRSRWAVLAAAGIYGAIAREVQRRGVLALDQRVIIPRGVKLAKVASALRQALSSAPEHDRSGLWTRPRKSESGQR